MTKRPTEAARSCLEPAFPLGSPGEPVVLYDGPLGGIAEDNVPGVVELRFVPEVQVVWRVAYEEFPPDDVLHGLNASHAQLRLWVPMGEYVVDAHRGDWVVEDRGAGSKGGWML